MSRISQNQEPLLSFFIALVLLLAGLLSPSNEVDDKLDASRNSLLSHGAIVMTLALCFLVLWQGYNVYAKKIKNKE